MTIWKGEDECFACGQKKRAQTSYLRVGWVEQRGIPGTYTWIDHSAYVERLLCNACFRRINRVHRARFVALGLGLLGVPLMICVIFGLLMPAIQPHINRDDPSPLLYLLALALMGLMFSPILLSLLYVAKVLPKKTREVLTPAANEDLLRLGITSDWNLRSKLIAYRKLPTGKTAWY
jgi:hypothetical protein